MGSELIRFYKERVKPSWKTAFVATILIGLLVHLYKFTNYLPNRDSVENFYASQNIISSGRWLLSLACGITSYYDLPWVNGIVSLFWIGIAMVFITELFRLRDPVVIILSAGIMVAFPGITETFFFEYTADGYMLALALAAAAVYLVRLDAEPGFRNILSAAVCICCSCGIYQSYVPFALILSVCHLLVELLENRHDRRTCLRWIGTQVLTYGSGLGGYYIIWKLLMRVQGVQATTYQGISSISLSLGSLLNGLSATWEELKVFYLQWDLKTSGMTLYAGLNLLFLLAFALILIYSAVKSGLIRRKWELGLYVLGILAMVPFAGLWSLVSASVDQRPMMLVCLALPYILTVILFDRWAAPRVAAAAGLLMAVMVCNFGLIANISYSYLEQSWNRTCADGIQMLTAISEFDDQAVDVAFIGVRMEDVRYETVDENGVGTAIGRVNIPGQMFETTLLYDHWHTYYFLRDQLGMSLPTAEVEEIRAIRQTEEYAQMPCWPEDGSVRLFGDTVVVKLSD